MKDITSNIIGSLIQTEQFDDWWTSVPIEIPFLKGQKLKITFMDFTPEYDSSFIQDADKTLENLLSKEGTERNKVSTQVYKNCMDFLHAIEYDEQDKVLWDLQNEHSIWGNVYPQDIYVTRSGSDIYLIIACECEWEQEHGLQLVFKNGEKLTRVSEQDGHVTEGSTTNDISSEHDAEFAKGGYQSRREPSLFTQIKKIILRLFS